MSKDHSERINEHFSAISRDLTPASVRHDAHMLYAPFSCAQEVSKICTSVLSPRELQRADRFATDHDKARFCQRRAFRRFCGATALGLVQPLSQVIFEETEKGRPYLAESPGIWFSFSSFRFGFLGAWSSMHGIGVDIEDQTRNLEITELAREFFSGAEADAIERARGLERQRNFFQLWSLKEAALKSIGEGLPFGLDAFEFALEPDLRVVHAPLDHGGAELFDACVMAGTDSCATLVIRRLV